MNRKLKNNREKMKLSVGKYDEIEYASLQNEILQYIQNYQNVRNMMYVICFTMLGFFINQNVIAYYYLLPSMVIIPTYIISVHYVRSTERIATYISTFYEEDYYMINWQTRNNKFNQTIYIKKELNEFPDFIQRIYNKIHIEQFLPYSSMLFLCVVLYFLNLNYSSFTISIIIDIFFGLFIFFIFLFIIFKFQISKYDSFKNRWKHIKQMEKELDNND